MTWKKSKLDKGRKTKPVLESWDEQGGHEAGGLRVPGGSSPHWKASTSLALPTHGSALFQALGWTQALHPRQSRGRGGRGTAAMGRVLVKGRQREASPRTQLGLEELHPASHV